MRNPLRRNLKIVVIGGGTGSFTLLSTLKNLTPEITALVNMADDGGSTGVLRDELGVLPPGDVRQCLVALSDSSHTLRELFNYRFPEGTFSGHSFGNLFLSAVEKMGGSFAGAVDLASEVLNITGRVLPISLEECRLVLELADGTKVHGESAIGETQFGLNDQPKLSLARPAQANPAAIKAIEAADIVVIAPGDLYRSLAPTFLVGGITKALMETKAKVVFVANLVNKPVHTNGFYVHDYASELERIAAGQFIDFVLYNTDEPTQKILDAYSVEGEYPVKIDPRFLKNAHYVAIGGKFLSRHPQHRNENDSFILRSLIRHNADSVCRALMRIYYS